MMMVFMSIRVITTGRLRVLTESHLCLYKSSSNVPALFVVITSNAAISYRSNGNHIYMSQIVKWTLIRAYYTYDLPSVAGIAFII